MIKRLAPLFSLVLALGCGSPTAIVARFEFGEPFSLSVGEQALSADGSAIVRFQRVMTDSRCPINAVCVWAGEAIIEIRVMRVNVENPGLSVRVGDAEPEVAGGLAVRALSLTRQSTDPRVLMVPSASLRVELLP